MIYCCKNVFISNNDVCIFRFIIMNKENVKLKNKTWIVSYLLPKFSNSVRCCTRNKSQTTKIKCQIWDFLHQMNEFLQLTEETLKLPYIFLSFFGFLITTSKINNQKPKSLSEVMGIPRSLGLIGKITFTAFYFYQLLLRLWSKSLKLLVQECNFQLSCRLNT